MAIEHHFYLDTSATRHHLRDTLVQAGIGFEAEPDFKELSLAASEANSVTIVGDLSYVRFRPENGVVATRSVTFRDRKLYMRRPEAWNDFDAQTVGGVVALLKEYPDADAYWEAYDARRPVLLRRGGRLILSQALTEPDRLWDLERAPLLKLIDLPYVVEPLGPWPPVSVNAPERERRARSAAGR